MFIRADIPGLATEVGINESMDFEGIPICCAIKCKIRDFIAKIFLHLIPEPEYKASEPLRD
jgi:hypothetical protein